MKAAFDRSFRSALASLFIESQEVARVLPWRQNMTLEIGTRVEHQGRMYISTVSGRTSPNPPNHSAGISDGLLFFYNKSSLTGIDSNLYLFIGQNNEMLEIDEVDLGEINQNKTIENIVGLKKLKQIDTAFCVKRVDWVSGEYYEQYTDSGIQKEPFYVMTKELHVYKCLDNNYGSPSTTQPTGTQSSPILYGDGYVWKYMATIDPRDAITFLSKNYMPLRYKIIDDSSPQYIVQSSAKRAGITTFRILHQTPDTNFTDPEFDIIGQFTEKCVPMLSKNDAGSVIQITVTNPGSGYKERPRLIVTESDIPGSGFIGEVIISPSGTVTGIDIISGGSGYTSGANIFVVGNGSGAITECIVNLGIIVEINMIEVGSGYTNADAVAIPGTRGIIAEGIVGPRLGHGHNVMEELGVNVVSINASIPQNAYFPESLSFNQIGLLSGGRDEHGSILGEDFYTGPMNDVSGSILRKYDKDSGRVVYLNNIERIERVYGQEERLKVIIEF